MNKAITEGLILSPPAFAAGLDVWSSGDGTPGSDTYDGSANAALVSADQDFGGCLELLKSSSTTKLHSMGETPLQPGCYLRISARVKAISGNLPQVRVSAWAGAANNSHVGGQVEVGPAVTLTTYGEIVTISAIVATSPRTGVDLTWDLDAIYGHFGLRFEGANGGIVRIDDIEIEDVTGAFLREMMDWVDVRDFGAVGDGVTDDSDAFNAADNAADGRSVLVPDGTYYIGSDLTIDNPVRFQGTLSMPDNKRLILIKNYDLPSYINAFDDELLAFKKAIQALFKYSNHDSLDLGGRRIEITEPIDVQAAVSDIDNFATRRVIRNGQLNAIAGSNWDNEVVTSQATYSTSNPKELTNVSNVANIPVGALITGGGVGREVYVKKTNIGASTVTLSQQLFDAAGTQSYTFTRFKYILDFSGFSYLDKFVLSDIEFQCSSDANAIMLPPEGLAFHVRDCFFSKPSHRAITSSGGGCQGMLIDRCQFLSSEQPLRAQDRQSVAFNVNSNDAKVRDNRVVKFAHFGVLNGTGHLFSGNHFFAGDNESQGIRQAGLIFTSLNLKSTITGNYIDNCSVELTNEHDATPDFSNQYSFGGLTINGNIFTANDVAPWFNWIVIKPYGQNHYIHGLNISGNTFRVINGNITRVDLVDETYASLDMDRARNVTVVGNTFNAVDEPIYNPCTLKKTVSSDSGTWTVDLAPYLPFGGWSKSLVGVLPEGKIQSGSSAVYNFPYASLKQGSNKDQVKLIWGSSCRGTVHLTARMDQAT